MGVARVDFRYKITSKQFAALMANIYGSTFFDRSIEKFDYDGGFGIGLRYGIKTFIGPTFLDLYWNSYTHHFGAYLNIGYFF